MNSAIHNHRPFSNNTIEPHLIHIERALRSESEVHIRHIFENVKFGASLIFSSIITLGASFCGYKASQLYRGTDTGDNWETRALGVTAGGLGALFCAKIVVHHPDKINKIRNDLLKDVAYKKMVFAEYFDCETQNMLRNVTTLCPITGSYPRFPVRDKRACSNGEGMGQVYDWAGLQYLLDQPPGKRGLGIDFAKREDFEFCEEQCRRIHYILYTRGEIRSEDPVESLEWELKQMEDRPISQIDDLSISLMGDLPISLQEMV